MKWRLEAPHHIDEQVLEEGTIIGDETQWPYRAIKDDPKIKRKAGDHLPPSTNMTPMDEEARKAWRDKYGDEPIDRDPFKSVPLTGAQNAPMVKGPAAKPMPEPPKPVNEAPKEAPKVGMAAEKVNPPEPKTGASAPGATVKEEPKPTSTHPSTPTPKV